MDKTERQKLILKRNPNNNSFWHNESLQLLVWIEACLASLTLSRSGSFHIQWVEKI